MQGRVIVNVLVGVDGIILKTVILRSAGFGPLDHAAVGAIKSVPWLPALQREKPVEAWVAVPVVFKLR